MIKRWVVVTVLLQIETKRQSLNISMETLSNISTKAKAFVLFCLSDEMPRSVALKSRCAHVRTVFLDTAQSGFLTNITSSFTLDYGSALTIRLVKGYQRTKLPTKNSYLQSLDSVKVDLQLENMSMAKKNSSKV